MDRETRNRIQRATQGARELLEHEYAKQLEGVFDVRLDGTIASDPGEHLDAAQRVLRGKLVTAVEHQRTSGMSNADAVGSYLREAAFTTLNRFVALKMLEARELVQECISRGDQSAGFKEFTGLAPGLVQLPDHGYRIYIESLFDEIGREVRVLFDRRDPASLLWPRRQGLLDLLGVLNAPELGVVWAKDETIGWVYQYFNGDDERRQMRAASQAPRTSRELAVRNQFFTPRYVVQFLTDNTLGRIWYEMRRGNTRLRDLEYLVRRPNEIFLAEGESPPSTTTVNNGPAGTDRHERPIYLPFRCKKDPRDIRVLDPASGSGHFLLYAFDLFVEIYEEAWEDETSPAWAITGKSLREEYANINALRSAVPGLVLRHNLYGIDIDARCSQIAALALWMRTQRAFQEREISRSERPPIQKTNVVVAEPIPVSPKVREEFTASLEPKLRQLVVNVFEHLTLAGEVGSLLRIEETIRAAVHNAYGEHGQLFHATDEQQWRRAEKDVLQALRAYAERPSTSQAFRRRLFADDAARGLGFIDNCALRYDVVLMNPPFGLSTKGTKSLLKRLYPDDWTDLYSAFVSRTLELLSPAGTLGAITSNLWLSIKRQTSLRALVSGPKRLRLVADLGGGVLDDATVNTALSVIDNLPARQTDDVGFYVCRDANTREETLIGRAPSYVRLLGFAEIPTTPFCFELGQERVALWSADAERLDPTLALTFKGNGTFDNFRFLRAHWEVPVTSIGSDWIRYDKGGFFQPFFNPSVLLWRYERNAAENRAFQIGAYGTDAQVAQSIKHWEKPGLCYSRATSIGFSPRILAAGHVVNDKSIALLPKDESQRVPLLALLASTHVQDLLFAFGYHRNIEKGAVASLPLGRTVLRELGTELDELGRKAIEAMFRLESTVETSPVFLRPAHAGERTRNIQAVLSILSEIDAYVCQALYGRGDIATLSTPKSTPVKSALRSRFADWDELVRERLSHAVGLAFGRWSTSRLTDELGTAVPRDFFAALPSRQPGADGTFSSAVPNGIAHVDEGHEADLPRLVAAIEDGATTELPEVREWLANEFFAKHLAAYSQSGRSAPIYWQLAPLADEYSVWLYYHRFTKDTLYRVLNDFVLPKLRHEERKLASLVQDAGSASSASQRQETDAQESFVSELRAFKEEVARVAPLWNPDLNDGVMINFAPLWRLVPQHRAWQKECKSTWDKLCKGDYDWARLAMHLWPERVVPKCAEDRSLAIAHGLEDVFWWYEDSDGKWKAREAVQDEIDKLVKERTSAGVKDALKSLLEAPAPATGRTTRKKAPRAKGTQKKMGSPRPTAATNGASSPGRSSGSVDAELMSKVKAAIGANGDGASKVDVIEATGISASEWNKGIKALLADGSVNQTGERRGATYHLGGGDA